MLRHRALTITSILGLFVASLLLAKKIGTEFFPDSDEAQFVTVYKTPVGTRVEVTTEIATKLEEAVKKVLGKDFTVQIIDSGIPAGRAALFSANTGPHAGTLQVNLVPKRYATPPTCRPWKPSAPRCATSCRVCRASTPVVES